MKKFLSVSFFFIPFIVQAQIAFSPWNDVRVVNQNNQVLTNAWAGGLFCPQFSQIDLNEDGKKDLFVFDRSNDKISCFLNEGGTGEINYVYTSKYNSVFPKLSRWALLRDYNGDGLEDIFTCNDTLSGISVYKNTSDNGVISFHLESVSLNALYGSFESGIYMIGSDIPAILDLDGDSDLDILLFETGPFVGDGVYYFKNQSQEKYHHSDSLDYKREKQCWGRFREAPNNCNVFLDDTNGACKNGNRPAPVDQEQNGFRNNAHAGSSVLVFDANGDGLYDLLAGDIGCSQIYLVKNDGNNEDAHMFGVTNNFPPDIPIDIPIFPATFFMDINNDGIKDLLAAPNISLAATDSDNVWLYLNNGSTSSPQFSLSTKNFLKNSMIDVGHEAIPVFFDYNHDNKKDLLIGNYGYYINSSNYRGQIALYENTGTNTIPQFKHITNDYQGISGNGLNALAATTGDLDNDGDSDMLIGASDGALYYFKNTAGTSADAHFIFNTANYQHIDVGYFAKPQLIDMNHDGKKDLIIGEREPNINYYEDTSQIIGNPQFKLITDTLGGITFDYDNIEEGYSSPVIADMDGNGKNDLLLAEQDGKIYYYENIEEQLSEKFKLTKMISLNVGRIINIDVADLDDDGKKDLVVGTYSGGLMLFKQVPETFIASTYPYKKDIRIFPNPAQDKINIISNNPEKSLDRSIYINDVMGRTVLYKVLQESTSIDISALSNGLYFIHDAADASFSGMFQVLRKGN